MMKFEINIHTILALNIEMAKDEGKKNGGLSLLLFFC